MKDTASHPLHDLQPSPDPRDPRAPRLLEPWKSGDGLAGRTTVLGLPYDGGIPTRPGARFGPRALREAMSVYSTFDGERVVKPVTDLGNLDLSGIDRARAHERIESSAHRLFAAGAKPIFIGGDHGCTGSVIRGLASAQPGIKLALVTIDAHLDVREYEDAASLSSGTPFRRALETPVLTGMRTAMIGIRPFANSLHYMKFARQQQIYLATVEEVAERGAVAVAEETLTRLSAEADALYLSIDLDAADAGVAPGVSAPGVGGLTSREMIMLVRAIGTHPLLIGADIMELSPPYDVDGRTAKLGARLLLETMRRDQA